MSWSTWIVFRFFSSSFQVLFNFFSSSFQILFKFLSNSFKFFWVLFIFFPSSFQVPFQVKYHIMYKRYIEIWIVITLPQYLYLICSIVFVRHHWAFLALLVVIAIQNPIRTFALCQCQCSINSLSRLLCGNSHCILHITYCRAQIYHL